MSGIDYDSQSAVHWRGLHCCSRLGSHENGSSPLTNPPNPEPPRAVTIPTWQALWMGYSGHDHFRRTAGGADYHSSHHWLNADCMPTHSCMQSHSNPVTFIRWSPFYRGGQCGSQDLGKFPKPVHSLMSSPYFSVSSWHQTPSLMERGLCPWFAPMALQLKKGNISNSAFLCFTHPLWTSTVGSIQMSKYQGSFNNSTCLLTTVSFFSVHFHIY